MLLKAFITKDLKSYSLGHIALSNSGNVIYWLYVVSLPFGPIWFLQGFFTISDVLMLLCLVNSKKTARRERVGNKAIADPTVNADLVMTQSAETFEKSLRGIHDSGEAVQTGAVQVRFLENLGTYGRLFPM